MPRYRKGYSSIALKTLPVSRSCAAYLDRSPFTSLTLCFLAKSTARDHCMQSFTLRITGGCQPINYLIERDAAVNGLFDQVSSEECFHCFLSHAHRQKLVGNIL